MLGQPPSCDLPTRFNLKYEAAADAIRSEHRLPGQAPDDQRVEADGDLCVAGGTCPDIRAIVGVRSLITGFAPVAGLDPVAARIRSRPSEATRRRRRNVSRECHLSAVSMMASRGAATATAGFAIWTQPARPRSAANGSVSAGSGSTGGVRRRRSRRGGACSHWDQGSSPRVVELARGRGTTFHTRRRRGPLEGREHSQRLAMTRRTRPRPYPRTAHRPSRRGIQS